MEGGPLLFGRMGMGGRFGALGVVTVCVLQGGCLLELPDPAEYVLDATEEPGTSSSTSSGQQSGATDASTGSASTTSGEATTLAVAVDETSGVFGGSSVGIQESTGDLSQDGESSSGETGTTSDSTSGAEPEPGCGSEGADTSGSCVELPDRPLLLLQTRPIKEFAFSWEPQAGVDHYHLEELRTPEEDFVRIVEDARESSLVLRVPLHLRHRASYRLQACNAAGCTSSDPVTPDDALVGAIGYIKASDAGGNHNFGVSLRMSSDGRTIAVGSPGYNRPEPGTGTSAVPSAGAVYIYEQGLDDAWEEHAIVGLSPRVANSLFGATLALSGDGRTLAAAAVPMFGGPNTTSERTGTIFVFVRDEEGAWTLEDEFVAIEDPADAPEARIALSADGNTLAMGLWRYDDPTLGQDSGLVLVFGREAPGAWSLQASLQASNTEAGDGFGRSLALSAPGDVLAVGVHHEDGNANSTIGADNNAAQNAGAVYVFVRESLGGWSEQHYLKVADAIANAAFGSSLAFGGDDALLAVGAPGEGNEQPGAVYVFQRAGEEPDAAWSEHARYVAPNGRGRDWFGFSVALDGRGELLLVGAPYEGRNAAGVYGHPDDAPYVDVDPEYDPEVGGVYVFRRDSSSVRWPLTAYLKSSLPQPESRTTDRFGEFVATSADGQVVAVGVPRDDGISVRLGHPPAPMPQPAQEGDGPTGGSGAVFLY